MVLAAVAAALLFASVQLLRLHYSRGGGEETRTVRVQVEVLLASSSADGGVEEDDGLRVLQGHYHHHCQQQQQQHQQHQEEEEEGEGEGDEEEGEEFPASIPWSDHFEPPGCYPKEGVLHCSIPEGGELVNSGGYHLQEIERVTLHGCRRRCHEYAGGDYKECHYSVYDRRFLTLALYLCV